MPEPQENETRDEFMERCIPVVLEDGAAADQDQAVAMCSSMFEQSKKSLTADVDETLVAFGSSIKLMDDGRVGGYLVTFGDPQHTDLEGDYFSKETDFDIEPGDKTSVYFNHRLPLKTRDGKSVAIKSKIGEGTLEIDDTGVLIDAVLYNREQYEEFLTACGWSSGTAEHLVDREQVGKAYHIKRWPLGKDASITPVPAEPRNRVLLKSLLPQTEQPTGEAEGAGDAPPSDGQTGEAELSEIKHTETNIMEITEEKLQEMIATASKAAADEAVKSVVDSLPPTNKGGHIEVVKDESDQEFETPGQFFKAVKDAALYPFKTDVRLLSRKATGMSEGVPSDGGYLLSPQVASGIIERMYGIGDILSRVANDPVGPNSNSMLYNAVDETSRVDASRWGGLLGYWLAEGGTKTATKPKFRQMELKLKKVAALCYATDEQLEDTVNLESWLMRTVPEELRFQVEAAVVRGDGIGKPLGILNSPCLVSPLRVDANQIDETDIATLWSRRWAGVNDYVWLTHPSIFPQLAVMSIAYQPVYLPPGGYSAAPYGTIFGKPVIENEYCSTLGTAGDIILASLSQYQTITKGGIKADTSIHVSFTTDETAFRFVFRIDGQPLWDSALTPYQGSSTVSPFVTLSAASA